MNLKTALQSVGWNGKFLVNVMPWVGEPNHVHRNSSYKSTDPFAVEQQLDNIQAVGGDGVVLTWRGISIAGGWDQQVAVELAYQCTTRKMLFAYMLDPNMLKYRPNQAITSEQEIINAFNSPTVQEVMNSGAYLPEKYAFDFNLASANNGVAINWAAILQATGLVGLRWHVDYSWACFDPISIIAADHQKATMKFPSVAYGFNDSGCPLPYGCTPATFNGQRDWTQSVWQANDPSKPDPNNPGHNFPSQPARVNDPQGGKYYMDCVASIGASATAKASPYAMFVTWNDYDEGTAVESFVVGLTGIRIGK
jgi:hypothetical protein